MTKWCSSFWKQRSLRLPGPRAQPSAAALLTPKNPFCHFIILNLKWYYTEFLPALVLRYDLSQRTIVRASWYSSISRPKFGNSALRRQTNFDDEEVIVGNAELEPYQSMNFDASVESYFEPLGAGALEAAHC